MLALTKWFFLSLIIELNETEIVIIMFDYHFDNTIVYDAELGALMVFEDYEIIDGGTFWLPQELDTKYAQF